MLMVKISVDGPYWLPQYYFPYYELSGDQQLVGSSK